MYGCKSDCDGGPGFSGNGGSRAPRINLRGPLRDHNAGYESVIRSVETAIGKTWLPRCAGVVPEVRVRAENKWRAGVRHVSAAEVKICSSQGRFADLHISDSMAWR